MQTTNDVHQQFAEYFATEALKPYAYLLSKKLSEGHICINLDKPENLNEQLPAYYKNIEKNNKALKSLRLVASDGTDKKPFVLFQNRLYLQRYFRYETSFLERIRQFLQDEKMHVANRMQLLNAYKDFIQKLFVGSPSSTGSNHNDSTDWQLVAAVSGVLNNFTIITGGPGTGKTTTVAKILAILYTINPGLKVALAAPTGKAASRMAESLSNSKQLTDAEITATLQSLQPSTIHRLLRSKKDSPYFHHDKNNPLNYDVIIVDECSMIDVALFAKLLNAIGPDTRVILLGDKDQLASVEAGSLFGDLCQSQPALNLFSSARRSFINNFISNQPQQIPADLVTDNNHHPLFGHLIELRQSHRFRGDTGIGSFSKAIILNDQKIIKEFIHADPGEQVYIDQFYSKELFEKFISGYEAFVKEKDILKALRLLNNQRVLCAIREGEQGLYTINKSIEKFLHDRKKIKVNTEFYENRPIILTRNYYDHGLFNGDTAIIRPDKKGILMAWFEDGNGGLKSVLPGYLSDAETAFAMTIHKSQGSEFNEVLVILPQATDVPILTRELLYTAVTRAKTKVYLQSSEAVLMICSERFVERASGIATRFVDNN